MVTPVNTVEDWGKIRVRISGEDRTWFRDRLTIVTGWQDTDPYGSNNAGLLFPQITEFDDIENDPEFDWLTEGAQVRIDHVDNGAVVKNLWVGFIDRLEVGEAVTASCVGNLLGRLTLAMHQPPILRRTLDVGSAIWREVDGDTNRHYDMLPENGIETGIEIAVRGSRDMTRLGFVDHCLGLAVKPNGDSLTILPDVDEGARAYRMQWRTMGTADATMDAGAHGVKVRLSKDLVDEPNRVYAEWITPAGERCRGAVYPNLGENKTTPPYPFTDGRAFGLGTTNADTDTGSGIGIMVSELRGNNLIDYDKATGIDTFNDDVLEAVEELQRQANVTVTGQMTPDLWTILYADGFEQQSFAQAHFRPVASDSAVEYFKRGPDGTPFDINPDFDPSVVKVEQFISYGEGMRSKQVRRNARAIIARQGGWTGTVTLTSDPAEMSRFDLRAGMVLKARYLKGTGAAGLDLYISSVQVDWASNAQSVTLAVSTTARHYIDLATRKQRKREARQDPAQHWAHQLRRSARTADNVIGWEGESGAGLVPETDVAVGGWKVIPVVACEYGTMSELWLQATAATTYYTALFAAEVQEEVLNAVIGDPSVWVNEDEQVDVFMEHLDWLREDERRLIQYWGTPDQPCGLFPKPYLNVNGERSSAPINGRHEDDASWTFGTERNHLYLAVWADAPTTITGRMRIVLGDQ